MALYVHKYGGTSMGSIERIQNVAKRVAKWHDAGHQIVVVPSAMSGETNRLLGMAKEIMASELLDRQKKTERLRALRLAQPAPEEPAKKARGAKKA